MEFSIYAGGDGINGPEANTEKAFFLGELSEGLPGFAKGVASVERNDREPFDRLRTGLGDPNVPIARWVG
jgi:hypothetical protein